jgi:hypothetical protein
MVGPDLSGQAMFRATTAVRIEDNRAQSVDNVRERTSLRCWARTGVGTLPGGEGQLRMLLERPGERPGTPLR